MSIADELDLDEGEDVADNGVAAKDADGVPYCRKHHCRMERSSGGKKDGAKVYYKCRVAKCEETAQIIKTQNPKVVPDQPQSCPRCSTEKSPVICERDNRNSNAMRVILQCPKCQWKLSPMAVPQLAASHLAFRKRPAVEDIGAR